MENSSKKRLIINWVICIAVILVLLGIDIATKLIVRSHFNGIPFDQSGEKITVINNFLYIKLVYNPGAVFSFLANAIWGRVFLSILSVAGTAISVWYLIKHFKDMNIWLRIALYLFIPGCTGNLIDRVNIYNTPGVIDMISVFPFFGSYEFATFNFADSCLTISIIVFFIYAIFLDKEEKKKAKNQDLEKTLSEAQDVIEQDKGDKDE